MNRPAKQYLAHAKDVKGDVPLRSVEDRAKLDAARMLRFEPVLKRLRLLRNIVLNPYSHPSAPNIPTTEAKDAIAEADKLIAAIDGRH